MSEDGATGERLGSGATGERSGSGAGGEGFGSDVTSERLMLVVRLHVAESAVAGYERFEREVAHAMAVHGGRIERVVRRADEAPPDAPFEIHLASFPDEAAFAAYRADPATRALSATRDAVVERTDVFVGREVEGYGPHVDGAPSRDAARPPPEDFMPADDDLSTPLSARWTVTPERLSATFVLASFPEAIAFMTACLPAIEALDHHPDWTNGHRRVHVVLTTHSAGRVTDLDHRLAVLLDRVHAAFDAGASREGSVEKM